MRTEKASRLPSEPLGPEETRGNDGPFALSWGRALWAGRRQWISNNRRSLVGYGFIAPAIVYLFLLCIYPMIDILIVSFTDMNYGVRSFVGLDHYVEAAQEPLLWTSVRNTVILTLGATALHLVVGLSLALLLNETWFSRRLRNVARGMLILPWVFSTASAGLMWSLLYHPFGLLNYVGFGVLEIVDRPVEFLGNPSLALWAVILVGGWKSFPFYMIAMLGGLQGISQDLYEAAKVDGANRWQRFRHVTIPQLWPVLVAVSTIDLITTFGAVDLINMLTKGGPGTSTFTVAYYTYNTGLVDGRLSYAAAISTLMLGLLAIATFFYLRMVTRKGGDFGESAI